VAQSNRVFVGYRNVDFKRKPYCRKITYVYVLGGKAFLLLTGAEQNLEKRRGERLLFGYWVVDRSYYCQ